MLLLRAAAAAYVVLSWASLAYDGRLDHDDVLLLPWWALVSCSCAVAMDAVASAWLRDTVLYLAISLNALALLSLAVRDGDTSLAEAAAHLHSPHADACVLVPMALLATHALAVPRIAPLSTADAHGVPFARHGAAVLTSTLALGVLACVHAQLYGDWPHPAGVWRALHGSAASMLAPALAFACYAVLWTGVCLAALHALQRRCGRPLAACGDAAKKRH